jgi:uncharacterized membrane protein YfcA
MGFVLVMLALGMVAGVLSGLLGIGGGIVVIPALVYFAGMSQKMAQGTTLLMMVPPIGLLAALEYLRRGDADWKAAILLCSGFVVGGFLGAIWMSHIPSFLLRRLFALLLILVGLKMFIRP